MACDGGSCLVVWRDARFWFEDGYAIYGVVVNADGSMPAPLGFLISRGREPSIRYAVAAGGGTFLVVWQTDDAGTRDIEGVRVSAAGDLLDDPPIVISSAPGEQALPDVAAGGGEFFVVWQDRRGGLANDIYGARVSAAGAVLDPDGIAISAAPADQSAVAIAFDGAGFVVAWDDLRSGMSRDVYAARVSAAGAVLDPGGIEVSTATSSQTDPDVASDGAGALVVWKDHRGGGYDIYGARLSPSGAVLDPGGLAISTAPGAERTPAVAAGAGAYLVAWEDERGGPSLYGARVSPAGAVLDPGGLALSEGDGERHEPALGPAGSGWLVVWDEMGYSEYNDGIVYRDIEGARVAATGAVLDQKPKTLSLDKASPSPAAAAWNGELFLSLWRFSGPHALVRLSAAGQMLDPIPALIDRPMNQAAVASDGEGFLVAWMESTAMDVGEIFAARVSAAGALLDPSGIPISTYGSEPSVAFGGGVYLLTWVTDSGVVGVRVSPEGDVLDTPPISLTGGTPFTLGEPNVAFGGDSFLVAWADGRHAPCAGSEIHATRVSPSGTVLDPGGLPIATGPGYRSQLALGFAGSSYEVRWTHSQGVFHGRYGTRVSPSGVVLDPISPLLLDVGNGVSPDLSCGASACLATWSINNGPDEEIGAHGAWLDPAAAATRDQPFPITPAVNVGHGLKAAAGGDTFLILYDTYDAPTDTYKARARLVSRPLVGPCQVDLDCATGHCVDGVCCDTACGGGDPGDCQACSAAAGAPADGTCASLDGVACEGGECSEAGVCQAGACAAPAKPDGAPCDAGACQEAGACQAGACVAPPAPDGTACPAAGDCVEGGVCQAGACAPVPKSDGVECPGGTCAAGACAPLVCPDQGAGGGGAGGEGGGGAGGAGGGGGAAPGDSPAPEAEDAGCGCRAAGAAPPPRGPGALAPIAIAAALLALRRRRAAQPLPIALMVKMRGAPRRGERQSSPRGNGGSHGSPARSRVATHIVGTDGAPAPALAGAKPPGRVDAAHLHAPRPRPARARRRPLSGRRQALFERRQHLSERRYHFIPQAVRQDTPAWRACGAGACCSPQHCWLAPPGTP
jgi:hypothetical protein